MCTKLPIHAPRAGRILHGSVAERVASAAYFEERDALSQWASERLKHGPDLQEKRTDLFNDFASWAKTALSVVQEEFDR